MNPKTISMKPPAIVPRADNPAVKMGLKLMEQQRKKKEKEQKKKEPAKKKTKRAPIWCVDFEGTITTRRRFPNIGEPNIKIIELLKMARLLGVRVILWTCREGDYLTAAVDWCKGYGLEFDAINENLPEAIEYLGRNTRKVLADIYIDDKSFHIWDEEGEGRLCKLLQEI